MLTTSLNFLIPKLRLNLGDTDATSERYLDEWLRLALVCSVESLQKWWNFKYLVEDDDDVFRNPNTRFLQPEPPVIERADHRPIILMASIILKSGELQNLSFNVGAWRDAEISFSNIEGSRSKRDLIKQDFEELTSILKPPQKRLAFSRKEHLQGYRGNIFEHKPDE